MSADRSIPVDNLPDPRARCVNCHKALQYWTDDTYGERDPQTGRRPVVSRIFEGWRGYPRGAVKLFCTLRCALRFAVGAYEAGMRRAPVLHIPPLPPAPTVDRSACREQVCTCHDNSAWNHDRGDGHRSYQYGCTTCGCKWSDQ